MQSITTNFNNRRINFLLTLLLGLFTGCKKFLEIDPPKTELVTSSTFASDETANAAVIAIYSRMINEQTFSYYIPLFTGISGDELSNYSSDASMISFYHNGINPTDAYLMGYIWSPAYDNIYQANAIIEGVTASETISPKVKHQLLGEAKFIRAFWHFYLVNLFGDIPIIKSTDYTLNSVASRSPQQDVYQQVIADLIEARDLLSTDYTGADGVTPTEERVRPNKWCATALLARVYLYTKDYGNAEIQSTAVINEGGLFTLSSTPDQVFLKNSAETIWAMQPSDQLGYNTPEGYNFILFAQPQNQSISRVTALSETLINSFEANDSRRNKWVQYFDNYAFPYKYKIAEETEISEYSIVFRLAEQYLIRSEARAQRGKIEEAKLDLNTVRNRSNLPNTTASDQSSLLVAIEHEREVELFTEWGHRWLDLKRTGRVDVVMRSIAPKKGADWVIHDQLYPIPELERRNNVNLKQNTGY